MKTYKVTKCARGGKTEATVEASNLREATEKAFKAVNYRDIRNAVVNDIFIHLNGEKKLLISVACKNGLSLNKKGV